MNTFLLNVRSHLFPAHIRIVCELRF
jgi:hypothetical protein